MIQELRINVPYGYDLVTCFNELVGDMSWVRIGRDLAGLWIPVGQKEVNKLQNEKYYYAKRWPIPDGWKLVPVGEKRPDRYKYWNADGRGFLYGPCVGDIICEDDALIICEITQEPRVFWGELCDEVKPHYTLPPFIHSGPNRQIEEWDCIPIWAKQNGWIFKGFYLDKETPMPLLFHPINMETGDVAQYAKFEKVGE